MNFFILLKNFILLELYVCTQGRSQTFIPGGGPSGRQGGQAKFSKYFSLVENNLKLVLKF